MQNFKKNVRCLTLLITHTSRTSIAKEYRQKLLEKVFLSQRRLVPRFIQCLSLSRIYHQSQSKRKKNKQIKTLK